MGQTCGLPNLFQQAHRLAGGGGIVAQPLQLGCHGRQLLAIAGGGALLAHSRHAEQQRQNLLALSHSAGTGSGLEQGYSPLAEAAQRGDTRMSGTGNRKSKAKGAAPCI